MPSDVYNQIISSLDIADIIGERVVLRPTSRGFMGLCPFHNEKTPSFHVYTDTQSYYCFGCHEGGNIFTFVMKTQGLDYHEALELLASRAGIKLNTYTKRNYNDYNEILTLAAKFFTDNLTGIQGTAARAYIQRRDLDKSDIARFSLGYSLNSWDSIVKFLRSERISDKAILDTGLALRNTHGLYDRFRGRLIFPIRDITGKVIAFGGRLIDGDGAKYINSPESQIYSKRKNLYLLHEARASIRDKGRSILVEGYMDALRLHKCGFTESVASLGTSLTPEQANLLSRFSSRCYICYDSDSAGQTATLRGMYILAEHGLDVHVINLPEGKDPDEFLSHNPPEKFEALIASAKPLIRQHIEALRPRFSDSATRHAAINELFEGLRKMPVEEVVSYKADISMLTQIPPGKLDAILSGDLPKADRHIPTADRSMNSAKSKIPDDEAGVCAMLFRESKFRLRMTPEQANELFSSDIARETARALLTDNPENLYSLWTSIGDYEKIELISRGQAVCEMSHAKDQESIWKSFIESMTLRANINRKAELVKKLQDGQCDLRLISVQDFNRVT